MDWVNNVEHAPELFLIAGPCTAESTTLVEEVAGHLCEITANRGIRYIFKASFDKANRSSIQGARGPGLNAGLAMLAHVRKQFNIPVITDVHEAAQVADVAQVVDVLQIPAMLCRQTDLLQAAAATNKPVNIKKGQYMSPHGMAPIADKARAAGHGAIWLCERGVSFGYNNLVVDMRSLTIMRTLGYPVVFDATHSVQLPGGLGHASSGQREFIPTLARAAIGVGIDGLFMETHPRPEHALSDGANSWPLAHMDALLDQLQAIDHTVKQRVDLSASATINH